MSKDLNPQKALIFRIVHRDNVPWILDHGLHCRNSGNVDPNYVEIGNPDLISKRNHHFVPKPPGGTLSDYVPFYLLHSRRCCSTSPLDGAASENEKKLRLLSWWALLHGEFQERSLGF